MKIRLKHTDAEIIALAAQATGETLEGFIIRSAMERASSVGLCGRPKVTDVSLDTTMKEAGFTARLTNAIERNSHLLTNPPKAGREITISDLLAIGFDELRKLPNIGPSAVAQAKTILAAKFGISL